MKSFFRHKRVKQIKWHSIIIFNPFTLRYIIKHEDPDNVVYHPGQQYVHQTYKFKDQNMHNNGPLIQCTWYAATPFA